MVPVVTCNYRLESLHAARRFVGLAGKLRPERIAANVRVEGQLRGIGCRGGVSGMAGQPGRAGLLLVWPMACFAVSGPLPLAQRRSLLWGRWTMCWFVQAKELLEQFSLFYWQAGIIYRVSAAGDCMWVNCKRLAI